MVTAASLDPVVRRFVEEAGNTTQSFGLGRIIGQIYAYLYFSPEPKNLADLQRALGVSKGSASTAVRQLEQWSAVKKVWVKGDRKDYYEASEWFGRILRSALLDAVTGRIAAYTSLLEDVEKDLNGGDRRSKEPAAAFVRERIARLRSFQKRAHAIWSSPLLQAILR